MELFPAADEEQFEFIKTVIDQSDYYIIISAGRYGSIHPETGLSYTEMEYDYAVETGKPVIRLLHKDPFNALRGEFIERASKGKKSLERFRRKMSEGYLVKFWSEPSELGLNVTQSLFQLMKNRPSPGWVRGIPDISPENSADWDVYQEVTSIVTPEGDPVVTRTIRYSRKIARENLGDVAENQSN